MKKKKLLFIPIFIIVILIAVFFLFFRQYQEVQYITIDGFEVQIQHNISFNQGEHSFYLEEIADLLPELFYIDDEDVITPVIELSEKTFTIALENFDDAPMPSNSVIEADKEAEYVLFDDITFTEVGVFNYRISITIEDENYFWLFDEAEFLIKVHITEDDNELSAKIIIEDELLFVNEYQFDIIDPLNESIERIQEETRQAEEAVQEQVREQNQAVSNNQGEITPMFIQGILLVNKHHPLPRTWNPGEDPRAGAQVRLLINEMRSLNFDICTSFSGFRSWDRQQTLFNNFAAQHGVAEAERFSARPGHSEHQTGLAFDLRHTNGNLVTRAQEANWLAANAHRFGFIVRYPAGREHITGFIHEPWHLRYIGARAEEIWRSGLTLEEFLGAGPAPTYIR